MSELQIVNVAQTVWPWRQKGQAPAPEDRSSQRKRAAIEGSLMVVVGTLFLLFASGHKKWIGAFVLTLAAVVWVGGFLIPPLYAAFRRFGAHLGQWVGVAFSWILLAPFFYFFFTMGHLILALKGKDPLCRAFDPQMKSYWTVRPRNPDPAKYLRQY